MTVPTTPPQTTRTVIPGPRRNRPPRDPDDGWPELVEAVREAGRYPTTAEAERVTRIVLSGLGDQVTGDERVALAQALPREAARTIASQIPVPRPRSAPEFVESIAARIEDWTPATARWHAGSVLSVLPKLTGEDLIDRLIAQLPPGYALLFGIAELTPAVPLQRT